MTICAAVLALSFCALWACALFMVPDHVLSLFRYRLWRLRDHLQDCILDERLPDLPVVNDLLDTVESMIEHADRVTLSSFLAYGLAGGHGLDEAGDGSFDLRGLSNEQRELLNRILSNLFDHMTFKTIAGSPIGAFFLPILLLLLKLRTRFWAKPLIEPQAEFRRVRDFRASVATRGKPARSSLVATAG